MIERTITAGTHGRYLVEPPAAGEAAPLLVGFHGYAEPAETQLNRMRGIAGADGWRIVSVQGLHRFYVRRTNEVVANWMTRQDRELAIGDNIAYAAAVVDAVTREWPGAPRMVFAGFSQGVAMMFRAAVSSTRPVHGVIAVGGDIPPELDAAALGRVRSALVCGGVRDDWYTTDKFDADVRRLTAAAVDVEPLRFDGGHEWNAGVATAASRFLLRVGGT